MGPVATIAHIESPIKYLSLFTDEVRHDTEVNMFLNRAHVHKLRIFLSQNFKLV